jgi:hypothetical protein
MEAASEPSELIWKSVFTSPGYDVNTACFAVIFTVPYSEKNS